MEVLIDAMEMLPHLPEIHEQAKSNGQQTGGGQGTRRAYPGSPPIHQCRICKRTYERADRLSRHLKSHENARRYQCQRCQKSFNRADLLRRHVSTHDRNALLGADHGSNRPMDRANQACIACAAAKARCEDQKPCRRCKNKNIACEVSSQASRSNQSQWQALGGDSGARNVFTGAPMVSPLEYTQTEPQTRLALQQGVKSNEAREQNFQSSFSIEANDGYNTEVTRHVALEQESSLILPQTDVYNMDSLHIDPTQLVFDNPMDDVFFFSNGPDFNNQNLDINLYDLRFNDGHLNSAAGMPIPPYIGESAVTEATSQVSQPIRNVRAGHAAFRRSPWLWTPAQKDGIFRDQENLALDENTNISALSPMSSASMANIPTCGFPVLNARERDKMFYMVSTVETYSSHIPGFPSLEYLNHIVEAFFVRHSYQVDNWIHIPSLSLSDIIPEYLIALVVAGSTVISVPAIWKMGLALQDVVRNKIGELWDRDNSNTRKLRPMQAWMLCLDTGLWSGFQRQMEIAESFSQPLTTMMRRGGVFGAHTDTQALVPVESDTGHILEAKWRKWAQRESFKRLAFHMFIHDTRASIALQKPPLVSVTEITTSLPASRSLFLAGSAAEWKTKYMEQIPSSSAPKSLKLQDIIQDITIIDKHHAEIDVSFCYVAALYGFWSQVGAFRESWKFHAIGDNVDSVHRLWITTHQRELRGQLESFKDTLLNMTTPDSELLIMVHLLLMILHVPPEELQRFAGKSGEDAANEAFAILERWSNTEQSRRAVWHAGQIFHWASLLPAAELRDFYAVAVYFACLTMWTYGHLSVSSACNSSKATGSVSQSLTPVDDSPIVHVNGKESSETRAFIAGRMYMPALISINSKAAMGEQQEEAGNEKSIKLSDPNAVLKQARDLYRNNFPFHDGPLPPLVENMSNLMKSLGSLSDNRFSRGVSPVERGSSDDQGGQRSYH